MLLSHSPYIFHLPGHVFDRIAGSGRASLRYGEEETSTLEE